jgi:hypothetical protein
MKRQQAMRRKLSSGVLLLGMWFGCSGQALGNGSQQSQEPAQQKNSGDAAAPQPTANKRLTIEVTGGDNNVAVVDASVYLKFKEGRLLRKDRKYELNVKTNREGTAHIPDPPLGNVLIQVVADGWKSYGKNYELTDAGAVIKIHLERPPKWY